MECSIYSSGKTYNVNLIKRTKIQISNLLTSFYNFHQRKLATDFTTYSKFDLRRLTSIFHFYFNLCKSVKNNDCFLQTWNWLSIFSGSHTHLTSAHWGHDDIKSTLFQNISSINLLIHLNVNSCRDR